MNIQTIIIKNLVIWNLAKVLVKLNQKTDAIRFYNKTLRLVKITKVDNKTLLEMKSLKNLIV
ncbi:hypothetical protein LCGC14_1953470 [marine sediment metagenome]|uniref:Bacterial transcriptional activator domain-containing protein n=1 Tax=marine sediment metagenome TaxID=412755 RepID=A0A0F9FH14_9ZZZZ